MHDGPNGHVYLVRAARPPIGKLRRRDGRYGLATLCLGGGRSVAMAFKRVA